MPKADGSILINTKIDVSQAEKDLAKLKSSIEKTETEVEELTEDKKKAEEESVFSAAELDAEKEKLEKLKKELSEIRAISKDTTLSLSVREEAKAQIPVQQSKISDQQTRVRMLQTEYNRIANSVDKYNDKLDEATKKLEKQQAEAGELAKDIASSRASLAMADAQEKAEKSMNRFALRLREVMRSALIFTLITQSLAKFREWMSKVVKSNAEASASMARLKGALLTLAQPLVDVLIPAFVTLVNVLTKVVSVAAQIVSMLFGKTAKQSAEAAAALNEQMNALEGVGAAAEESAGALASFDEINKLSGGTSGSGAASETIEPVFEIDTELPESRLNNILSLVTAIGEALLAWKISSALGGGLSTTLWSLALVASAVEFVKSIFDAWTNGVSTKNLITSMLSLGVAAAALYALLGSVAAGIGLVVGGIAMLVTGFRDAMENGWNLQNTLMAVAGIFATGLGISLITGSFIPALIGAIAGLLLAFTVAMGHGEELIAGVKQILSGFIDFFKGIFTGDLELAMSGVSNIFGGLKTIVGAVIDSIRDFFLSFLDWLDKKTGGKLKAVFEAWKALFTIYFDGFKGIVTGVIDSIERILSGLITFIAGAFTGDWDRAWEGVKEIFAGVWDGIASILEGVINIIIRALNYLITQMNKISFTVPDWVPSIGGKKVGINIPKISEYSLPRLATGAVVPPNREFMAVLGDNKTETEVVSPLSTMKQAMLEALQEAGGFGDGTVTVVVNLDGKEIARNQVKHINDMTRAAGKPVLLL